MQQLNCEVFNLLRIKQSSEKHFTEAFLRQGLWILFPGFLEEEGGRNERVADLGRILSLCICLLLCQLAMKEHSNFCCVIYSNLLASGRRSPPSEEEMYAPRHSNKCDIWIIWKFMLISLMASRWSGDKIYSMFCQVFNYLNMQDKQLPPLFCSHPHSCSFTHCNNLLFFFTSTS